MKQIYKLWSTFADSKISEQMLGRWKRMCGSDPEVIESSLLRGKFATQEGKKKFPRVESNDEVKRICFVLFVKLILSSLPSFSPIVEGPLIYFFFLKERTWGKEQAETANS